MDGRLVAANAGPSIAVIDLDRRRASVVGTGLTRSSFVRWPTWSPDGSKIALAASPGGTWTVRLVEVEVPHSWVDVVAPTNESLEGLCWAPEWAPNRLHGLA
jgi:Tol biopolymer transport system component